MTQFYVYTYFDPRTDLPFYVGKGQKYRARKHFHQACNKHMAWRLADLKANDLTPEIEIVYVKDEPEAFELEAALIRLYGRIIEGTGHLVNILEDGLRTNGFAGRRHTDEAKAKISAAHKGRIVSEETRAKQRAAIHARNGAACMHTPEAKEKRKATYATLEYRQRLSDHAKRTVTPERLAQMTARAAEVNRGRVESLEARARRSTAMKGRVFTPEARANMSAGQRRRYAK